jgi:hypothetical protein
MGADFSSSTGTRRPAPKTGVKMGYLKKQGSFIPNWKKRLFELDYKNAVLRYKDENGLLKGEVQLNGSWIQHIDKAITR